MLRDGGQALFKREMFGDQTPAIKHCSVTKRDDVVLSGITQFYNVWSKVRRRSNFIKHHQRNCPNAKMCRQHRIIHGVWSPNISRLDRAERSLPWHFQVWPSMIYIIHRCSHLRWTFSNSSSSSALIPPERPTYALSCRGTIFFSEWASTGKLMFFSRNSFVTCSPTWEGQQMRCNVSWEPDRSSGGM